MRKSSVTLLELLVVILIINAFIFTLSPFVKKARERAYRETCANNLRRIALALHKYALDHNDTFPAVSNLKEFVDTLSNPNALYVEDISIFFCPNTGHKKPSPGNIASSDIDYMYVSGLRADSPTTTPILADRVKGAALTKVDNHRKNGVNVLYVNGDVRWLTAVPSGKWVKD